MKINDSAKLEAEYENTKAVAGLFDVSDIKLVREGSRSKQPRQAALGYPIISHDPGSGVRVSELGEWFFDPDHHTAVDIIDTLYRNQFRYAHADVSVKRESWVDSFAQHLRLEKTQPLLREIFSTGHEISSVGTSITES